MEGTQVPFHLLISVLIFDCILSHCWRWSGCIICIECGIRLYVYVHVCVFDTRDGTILLSLLLLLLELKLSLPPETFSAHPLPPGLGILPPGAVFLRPDGRRVEEPGAEPLDPLRVGDKPAVRHAEQGPQVLGRDRALQGAGGGPHPDEGLEREAHGADRDHRRHRGLSGGRGSQVDGAALPEAGLQPAPEEELGVFWGCGEDVEDLHRDTLAFESRLYS